MTPQAPPQKFTNIIRRALSARVGMVFLAGQEPEDTSGTLPHPTPKGGKWAKFYLPPQQGFADHGFAVYPVPRNVAQAPRAEIVFRLHVGASASFARTGEEKSWGFGQSNNLWLKIDRDEKFIPLYIKARDRDGVLAYYRLDITWEIWEGGVHNINEIAVFLDRIRADDIPTHLAR